MSDAVPTLFDQIEYDSTTGTLTYPRPEGFVLDTEAVYRTVSMFLPFCNGDLTKAMRHAVHGQLTSYRGATSLLGRGRA